MNKYLNLDVTQTKGFYTTAEYEGMKEEVVAAHKLLRAKTGPGNDFLGWLDLPVDYDHEEFDRIKKAAQRIKEQSQVLLAIGIGGDRKSVV